MSKYRPTESHRRSRERRAALFQWWQSEGKPCCLCHEPIDFRLSGLDRMGPTEEHIIAVAQGGSEWAWENKAVSHRICNLRKGKKPIAQGRTSLSPGGTPSRDW